MLKELILKNRSYRRFYQDDAVPAGVLRKLIDLASITPSGANKQPLKYILTSDSGVNKAVFNTLKWAGYLSDWTGPAEGERPSAYIVVLGDTGIASEYYADPGIAMQTILLGAVEEGYGGCILASVDRDVLRKELNISGRYKILYVIALGKPKETVVLEEIKNGDVKYWRDESGIHHVPKRGVDELIVDTYTV